MITSKIAGILITSKIAGILITSKIAGILITSKIAGILITSKIAGILITSKIAGILITYGFRHVLIALKAQALKLKPYPSTQIWYSQIPQKFENFSIVCCRSYLVIFGFVLDSFRYYRTHA